MVLYTMIYIVICEDIYHLLVASGAPEIWVERVWIILFCEQFFEFCERIVEFF